MLKDATFIILEIFCHFQSLLPTIEKKKSKNLVIFRGYN